MRLKIIFLVLGIHLCFSGLAQRVPGYMGKRLIVGYDASSTFSMDRFQNKDEFRFTLNHNLGVEYVFTKQFAVEGTFSFFGDSLFLQDYIEVDDEARILEQMGFNTNSRFHPKLNAYVRGMKVGLKFKRYDNAHYAPLGKAGFFGVSFLFSDISYPRGTFMLPGYQSTGFGDLVRYQEINVTQPGPMLLVSFGREYRRVLFDFLSIKYGYEVEFPLKGAVNFLLERENYEPDEYLNSQLSSFALRRYLVNVKLGIGFLAPALR